MSAKAWWRRRNKQAWRAKHLARVCSIYVGNMGISPGAPLITSPDWRALLESLTRPNPLIVDGLFLERQRHGFRFVEELAGRAEPKMTTLPDGSALVVQADASPVLLRDGVASPLKP